jgi:hypothetical protein
MYVYGVVRPGTIGAVATQGVNGGAAHTLDDGDLAALVGEVPAGPLTGTKDDVVAHSRVLEEAIRTATVLPMRFGVVLDGPVAVRRDLLRTHEGELRELIGAMDGKVQLRVRAMYAHESALREIVAEEPEIAQLRQSLHGKPDDATYYDRIRLGEMIAEALERKRSQDADALFGRLEPLAVDLVSEPPVHEQMVLNAGLLVERRRLDEIGGLLEALGKEVAPRIDVRTIGPLPPYSFVELPDASREASWA